MGIPGFFHRFVQTFPNTVIKSGSCESLKNVDHLYVDGNGVLHPFVRAAIEGGANNIVTQVGKELRAKFSSFKTKNLHFMVDGVAPKGKVNQQRKRRYHKKPTEGQVFDTNHISPGTTFMTSLCSRIGKLKCWKTFSGAEVPGEGEQKIFRHIRDNVSPEETVVVHGLDADMIMLSMMSSHNNIVLLRENEDLGETVLVDVPTVREAVVSEFGKVGQSAHDAVSSFVVLISILGNDFIPSLASLHIRRRECGMDYLMEIYGAQDSPLVKNGKLHPEGMQELFANLSEEEDNRMNGLLKSFAGKVPRGLGADSTPNALVSKLLGRGKLWRSCYYRGLFSADPTDSSVIPTAVDSWIKGISWVLAYYHCPDELPPEWYYDFPYGPTAQDVYFRIVEIGTELPELNNSGIPEIPLSSDMQLMAILPPWSWDPKQVPNFNSKAMNAISYMTPHKFGEHTFLKDNDWECIPKIPPVDWELLHHVLIKK